MLCSSPDLYRPTAPYEVVPYDNCNEFRLSTTREMMELIDQVAGALVEIGYPSKDVFAVRLGLEEALVNAIKHGHKFDPTKRVEVRYQVAQDQFLACIEDEGDGFDPQAVPDPTSLENLERSCGRGLLLMRTYLTWVHYNDRGNAVTLCKIPSAPLSPP
jgi:serine/threonine-protein kinase RsbW